MKVQILNVAIDNLSKRELLENLESGVVFTPNADHMVLLQHNQDFFHAYAAADYRVCDSQILIWLSRFLGTPLKERISGSDFLPAFCQYHRDNDKIKLFILGGAEGIAKRAQQRINQRAGREMVIAAHSPSFGFERKEQECLEIIDLINRSGANVLAIGVGSPKQEIWIAKYRHLLTNIKIFLAVGAAIDFEAGNKQRAPEWISDMGMEWLYRLISEPKRLWKRYLVDDMPFFWLILKQKLNTYRSPFHSN